MTVRYRIKTMKRGQWRYVVIAALVTLGGALASMVESLYRKSARLAPATPVAEANPGLRGMGAAARRRRQRHAAAKAPPVASRRRARWLIAPVAGAAFIGAVVFAGARARYLPARPETRALVAVTPAMVVEREPN